MEYVIQCNTIPDAFLKEKNTIARIKILEVSGNTILLS